jgi:hypothetical protein
MKTFEERKKEYEDKIEQTGEELSVAIYAANVVMPNGEVHPMIKLADTNREKKEEIETVE